jgi:aspartyl aminopeptidase
MAALEHIHDLADFVVASPTAFHAAAEGARRLAEAGFTRLDEAEDWALGTGGYFIVRDGSLVAWRMPDGAGAGTGFRIIGAHTDSPSFQLKPHPDFGRDGWQQLGVEVYGGPLLNSWLDRELGLAGRLVIADGDRLRTELVRTGPIMRIPQLAIHLDRAVNEGLKLDRQQHTQPVWSVGRPDLSIIDHLAGLVGVRGDAVLGYDVLAYDTTAPAVFGADGEFFASGRLDNLSSVHAGLVALQQATSPDRIAVLAAFDHEEVGSSTRSGAAGPVLEDVLTRIGTALGSTGQDHHRALADSICLSADAGHAVHPNYPGHHDPRNRPLLNGGPLLKINAVQRYATDAVGTAVWRRACRAAGVPTQEFVSNNAIPCGSTIGPITATRLGITTVDVGIPLLSMHSAREMAGVEDPEALSRAMRAFLSASV